MLRQRQVPILDGRKLRISTSGGGLPPIVLSGGFRGSLEAWRPLQLALGERQQTLSYDRAGFGESPAGPFPRTTAATVSDLHEVLDAIGFERPFIFVGYSSGAFDAIYYAHAFSQEVAGLVLVDPTIPMLDRKLSRIQGLPRPKCPAPARLSTSEASEEASLEWESSGQIRAVRHRGLGALPLVVISSEHIADSLGADARAEHRDAVTRLWLAEHRRYAALSSRGMQEIAPNSNHDMLRTASQVIERAIAQVTSLVTG